MPVRSAGEGGGAVIDNNTPANRLRSTGVLAPVFNKCLLNTYYVPGRGPDAGDTVVSKNRQPPSHRAESNKGVGGSS